MITGLNGYLRSKGLKYHSRRRNRRTFDCFFYDFEREEFIPNSVHLTARAQRDCMRRLRTVNTPRTLYFNWLFKSLKIGLLVFLWKRDRGKIPKFFLTQLLTNQKKAKTLSVIIKVIGGFCVCSNSKKLVFLTKNQKSCPKPVKEVTKFKNFFC